MLQGLSFGKETCLAFLKTLVYTSYMLKNFFTRQLLKRQMKDVPKEEQERIITMVEKNPDLFKKISEEIEHRVKKGGEDQMKASIEVMKKYQKELQEIMQ